MNKRNKFYKKMLLIRYFEENLLRLFDEGVLFGTTHTSLGQEALAVAVSEAIQPQDIMFSNHRCHGHYIAFSDDAESLLLEIMGRVGGICEGYGGSQHIHKNNFYSNGIQGGYVPIVAGMAFAEKVKKSDAIVVGIIGDGTMGEGSVYEGLNLMSILNTPSLIIIEDNKYAQSTQTRYTTAGTFMGRAKAFDICCSEIESNDIFAIHEELIRIVQRVRRGQHPYVFIHHTYRLGPHSKGDDHRPIDEISKWKKLDPLKMLENTISTDDVLSIKKDIKLYIEKITSDAKGKPFAKLEINNLLEESLWNEDMCRL